VIEAILLSIVGLVGLAIGGEFLVKGSVGIAQKLGVSNLVTGLVIVGFATSMPEMVASVQAVMLGSPEIAWGNIAGSNIANAMLILGVTALIAPIVLTGTGRRDAVVALVVSAVVLAIGVAQFASAWLGAALLALLVTYIIWRYRHPRTDDEDDDESAPTVGRSIIYFVIGLALLVGGGKLLVDGAIDLARLAGISETVIGLTIVAIGTSLPELAASVAAALRGKSGLALGNVVGSNIYNILLIGGVTMILAPQPIPVSLNDVEWPLVVGTALIILLLCWFASRISRWMGAALLAGFTAFNIFLFL
jgi:cation:H+ antiporter